MDEKDKELEALEGAPLARVPPYEHPEDKKLREEGEAYGAKHGAAFAADHPKALAELIGTYADREAHDMLDGLREKFWAEVWKPRGKRR